VKDFAKQQREILQEAQKVKGAEQQKLLQKYSALGREFAEKVYKIAEDDPKGPVAEDALFWVLQFGSGSPVYTRAMAKVTSLLDEMPLKDLAPRLNRIRIVTPVIMARLLQRAEKEADDPHAPDLLAYVATTGSNTPSGPKAAARLLEKNPGHPAVERLVQTLANSRSRTDADAQRTVDALKVILEKSNKPRTKAAAALGLGKQLYARTDNLGDNLAKANQVAADAEKYLKQVIDQFGDDNPALKAEAERDLKALNTLRVGREAPEIKATDLDEKEFKLSDYRGKVVLLDFWGNW
jgi:hypothetical protein